MRDSGQFKVNGLSGVTIGWLHLAQSKAKEPEDDWLGDSSMLEESGGKDYTCFGV